LWAIIKYMSSILRFKVGDLVGRLDGTYGYRFVLDIKRLSCGIELVKVYFINNPPLKGCVVSWMSTDQYEKVL